MTQDAILTSPWHGFNGSSGFHRDRESTGDPVAKKTEISWNGYPLPQGLRITDMKRSLGGSMVKDWDRHDAEDARR